MFRINYGNGQVDGVYSTYAKAKEAYTCQVRFDRDIGQSSSSMFIERYEGDGEWFPLSREKRRPEVP